MAMDGKAVTLVDSDLWKPRIHHIFDVDPHVGFTNLLLAEREIAEVVKPTDVPGLSVICSGPLPPDSTTVLRSARAREVVAQLVNSTEVVVFDSPPLLVATDALMLSALVDCVLLIVAGGRTRTDAVRHAAEMLDQANPKIIGAVLNKMPVKDASNYGYYYYYNTDSANGNGSGRSNKRGRARRLLAKVIRR
jgi:capsular exopolysaccharide synthesis family protein